MENNLTGYQYGVDNQFIGEYKFDRNVLGGDLYLPPNTTLVSPPPAPPGMSPYWIGDRWVVKENPFNKYDLELHEEAEAAKEETAKRRKEEEAIKEEQERITKERMGAWRNDQNYKPGYPKIFF